MLTIGDIPDEYRKGQTDGENIVRLASGVQTAIEAAFGDPGSHALRRFVQAGFLFRSSDIGRVMISESEVLGDPLQETPQFVNFAGGALSASALVGAVDLSAAAMRRLYLGPVNTPDDGREADIVKFPDEAKLPAEPIKWLRETRESEGWEVLKVVRDQFVHRWFPLHVTIVLGSGGGALHHLEIAGQRKSLPDFMNDSREFVIDRLVAAGLVMDMHAKGASPNPARRQSRTERWGPANPKASSAIWPGGRDHFRS
jgi:hypothetical protein